VNYTKEVLTIEREYWIPEGATHFTEEHGPIMFLKRESKRWWIVDGLTEDWEEAKNINDELVVKIEWEE
jgi:hypothetical protein